MAASSGDLCQSLIEGGLAPAAARIIANALANSSSPQLSLGNDRVDSTPSEQLRLITPEVRKYQLTNLDYSPAAPFQKRISENLGAYAGGRADHPYKDSQPVSPTPPLSQPSIRGSDYVTVNNVVERNSNIAEVSLDIRLDVGGRHLRLDPSTKSLESVPFIARPEVPRFLASEFRETPDGTELVHGLRNLAKMDVALSNGGSREITAFAEGVETANGAFGGWLSWTPRLWAGVSPLTIGYTKQVGRYFRIGQIVFIHAEVTLDATAITWPTTPTNTGAAQLVRMSLPLTLSGLAQEYKFAMTIGQQDDWLTAGPTHAQAYRTAGGLPQVLFYTTSDFDTPLPFTNAQTGSTVVVSGFYATTGEIPLYPTGGDAGD